MSFFAAGADADEIADEFDDWADRAGATIAGSRLRDSRTASADGILILEAVVELPREHQLELLVLIDSEGNALAYRFNLFGPERGAPRVMWHKQRGHQREDGTICHVHRRGRIPSRIPDEDRSFGSIVAALDDELR